ncbi:transmembrane protein C16orf54 homolog [Pelodiscus sinensis]|uniref:transmembrane protein C16orf54 homolog n=1 Tax=Pelodiscus sinensis TaxID=13735 RepID=UPI003F6AC7F5
MVLGRKRCVTASPTSPLAAPAAQHVPGQPWGTARPGPWVLAPPGEPPGHQAPPLPAVTPAPPMAPSSSPTLRAPTPSWPPAPPCTACLVPMLALAGLAGIFVILTALLGERLFQGARARGVPSVWRRGGDLWMEPPALPPPDRAPPKEAAELWIPCPVPGAEAWYQGPASGSGSGASSSAPSGAPESTGSTAALTDGEEPTWGAQPHVTLQDISDFFRRGGGGLGRGR